MFGPYTVEWFDTKLNRVRTASFVTYQHARMWFESLPDEADAEMYPADWSSLNG